MAAAGLEIVRSTGCCPSLADHDTQTAFVVHQYTRVLIHWTHAKYASGQRGSGSGPGTRTHTDIHMNVIKQDKRTAHSPIHSVN